MASEHAIHPDDARWIEDLRGSGAAHVTAMRRLHEQLTKAARVQVGRMSGITAMLGRERTEEIIHGAADDAAVAVLARLDTFEGRSRLSTWIYKFGVFQASTEARRAMWRDHTVQLADDDADPVVHGPEAYTTAKETAEALHVAIDVVLTAHQRRVVRALLVEGVPIDVYAERSGASRSSLYKTVHEARQRLRRELTDRGYLVAEAGVTG